MLVCRNCAKELPPEAYYVSVRQPCKECVKERSRKYREDNLEKVQAYDRERGQLPHRKEANRQRAPLYAGKYPPMRITAPEKRKAHIAVGSAIKTGKLHVKPCERCGYGIGVQAHHEDYSKPLEVVWLCKPCHGQRHREINEQRRKTG